MSSIRHIHGYLPVAEWLPGYQKKWFRPDLIAGLTSAAVVIPKAMAFATIAGRVGVTSQRDQRRQTGRDKTRGSVLHPLALRVHETRRDVRPVYCPDSDVRINTRHTRF